MKRLGILRFLYRYIKTHLKAGYRANIYEVQARVYAKAHAQEFARLEAQ